MKKHKKTSRSYGYLGDNTEEIEPIFNKKSILKNKKTTTKVVGLLFAIIIFPFKIFKYFWDLFFNIIFRGKDF